LFFFGNATAQGCIDYENRMEKPKGLPGQGFRYQQNAPQSLSPLVYELLKAGMAAQGSPGWVYAQIAN